MEFYELNRLYDDHLEHLRLSKIIDYHLYILLPILISFGCGLSLINIIALSRPYFLSASKKYLLSQSIFNFLFQIVTSIILISNYYEKQLLESNFYFKNKKILYLNIKIFLNILYNIILYILLWLFVIGALDYCFISIIKFHLNTNYNRSNRKLFNQQQAQYNYQQRLLHQQQSRLRQKQNLQFAQQQQKYFSTSSLRSSFSSNPNGTVEESLPTENNNFAINTHVHGIYDAERGVGNMNSNDVFYDESNMFELNLNENKSKNKKKKKSDADDEIRFFEPKTIVCSIISILLFSVFLAVPQMLAFEVKHNLVTISPSPMPAPQPNSDNPKTYENIFFIEKNSVLDYEKMNRKGTKNMRNIDYFSYSKKIAQALGFTVRIHQDDTESIEILNRMRKTHSKFFTLTGYFNLASKQYELCNMVKNSEESPIIRKPSVRRRSTDFSYDTKIFSVNITIICIKKNDLNNLLTYNTLYFWLEHTMVISAPICIALVVLGSLVYTCVNFSKLLIQQNRLTQKRIKLLKLQQQNNLNNHKHHTPKLVHMKSSEQEHVDIITPVNNSSDDCFVCNATNANLNMEFDQLSWNEKRIRQIQHEDQNLNRMFIIDLVLYILMSFPYTLMRLVLDLFAKDHIKINLDFFILYKVTLLLFHLHLILKFFLLLIFNIKYRISLARAFSFEPSRCCIKGYDQEFHRYNQTKSKHSLLTKICCFCCLNCCLSKLIFNQSQASLSKSNRNGMNFDMDEENDRSTEFNTNLHQYHCPADPDQDLTFQTQNKISLEKFNLIENQT